MKPDMQSKISVAAIVVTFNRKVLLKECLDGLLDQTRPVDSIIIIDNASSDGTYEFLKDQGYLSKPVIDYIHLPENTGGAGGFHHGVKRGFEQGFDWLWLMDDDAEPEKDALAILLRTIDLNKDKNLGASAQTVIDKNGEICHICRGHINFEKLWPMLQKPLAPACYKSKESVSIYFASFVGVLISNDVVEKIGFPNKNFFIYHDDVEYSLRINKIANIYLIPNSIILHKYASKDEWSQKNFLWLKAIRPSIKSSLFSYFYNRNLIYIIIKYKYYSIEYFINLFIELLKGTRRIILFDDCKVTRLYILWKAIFDGILGKFDNSFIISKLRL